MTDLRLQIGIWLFGAREICWAFVKGESRLEAFLREGSLALVEKAHAAAREIMWEPYEAYNELLKESNRRYGQGRRIALN